MQSKRSNGWDACAVFLVIVALIGSLASAEEPPRKPVERSAKSPRSLLREGTRLEMIGRFHGGGGERFVFEPNDNEEPFRVLENLALERVSRMETGGKRIWSITAEVTEFRSVNYLIIRRAALQATNTSRPQQ